MKKKGSVFCVCLRDRLGRQDSPLTGMLFSHWSLSHE